MGQSQLFFIWIYNYSSNIYWKPYPLAPLNAFAPLRLYFNVWVYFWTHLFHWSMCLHFLSVLHCLDFCNLKIRNCESSNIAVFFSKLFSLIEFLLSFHINFRISLLIPTKILLGYWLERIDFIILSLLIQKHGLSFHLLGLWCLLAVICSFQHIDFAHIW